MQKQLAAALLILIASVALTQTSPVQSEHADTTIKFEVISIKPAQPGTAPDERFLPDGFIRTDVSLSHLIVMAYFPAVLWSSDRIKNAPDWTSEHYDLVGKVAPEDVAEWQKHSGMLDNKAVQSALQAALKDRCKLVVHRVPDEIVGYDVVVANRGPGPKMTSPDEVFPSDIRLHPDGSRSGFFMNMKSNSSGIAYYNATMEEFVASFSFVSGYLIQDKTGLTGRYDVILNDTLPIQGAEPDLYTSLKPAERYDFKSSGLRLQQTKVPITDLVIDHIERPSSN